MGSFIVCLLLLSDGKVLLFRQAMLFPEFFGRDAVLLFKGPEKAGVVPEAVLLENTADGLVRENRVFAGLEALFRIY